MNEEQRIAAFKAMMARRTQSHTQSPEAAKKWLKEEGLLDSSGRLRPQFGGDGEGDNSQ